MKKTILTSLLLAVSASSWAGTSSPVGANVYFISPQHGEVITGAVTVRFGLQGMGVAPAGTQKAKTGHHHLIIDDVAPEKMKPIAKDDKHKHFGGGQTETVLNLSPGKHRLRLVLGDLKHIPHNPPVMSEEIVITVK